MSGVSSWGLRVFGSLALLLAIAFAFLIIDASGHEKVRVIRRSVSPDGNVVAEVYEVITPMHGGPDTVTVRLRSTSQDIGDEVYSQVFECGPDYDAFQLRWLSTSALTISFGSCDTGRYRSPADNQVLQKKDLWKKIVVNYIDSGHVARAKL